MPYVLRPPRRRTLVKAVLIALVLGLVVLPAAARAACPVLPTSQPFRPWDDFNDYSVLLGGSFESGAPAWWLSRAAVVDGNEGFYVRSSSDTKSLAIDSGGSATSPAFCVGNEHPIFRFFARQTSGNWAVLRVSLRWSDGGLLRAQTVGTLRGSGGYTTWKPSPMLPLATTLSLLEGETTSVRLAFDPDNYGGDWAIDDVYIDPYRR